MPLHVDALVVGALGSFDPDNEALLGLLWIHRSQLTKVRRQMISMAIMWTRDNYVEHVSGNRQYGSDISLNKEVPFGEEEETTS